jgi:archaellum component FlaC
MTEEQLKKLLDAQAKAITENADDQIARLFTHMNERFDQIGVRIDGVEERIDRVQTTVDGIAKKLDNFEQEQTIINHQVDGKLNQLSEATNIKWAID